MVSTVFDGTDIHNTRNSPVAHIRKFRTIAFPHKERKVFMNANANFTYRQIGDYIIPNLTLSSEEANIKLGKWGMQHKDYLLKHKKVVFATLLAEGKLWQYLADIDNQAQKMFDTLVEQMKESEGVTEKLKEDDQMKWVMYMNNIEIRAIEIINNNLIYVYNSPDF